jgi:hypothetical protein
MSVDRTLNVVRLAFHRGNKSVAEKIVKQPIKKAAVRQKYCAEDFSAYFHTIVQAVHKRLVLATGAKGSA